MNRIPALLLLLCIPLLSACSSLGRDGRSHWRYRIDEHLPGSRFEQHTGTLFYRGRPVPEGIDLLYCPLGLFSRQLLPSSRAGITGWYRHTDRLPLPAGPAAPGGGYWWYAAPFAGRRHGTPGHWVWARIGAGEFWLDPAGLAYLAVREAGRR
jgi:hypothetical protein